MNCPKILELIEQSQELHAQALTQIQQFCDTFSDMRPKGDLNIFTELRKINTEYERLKSQINLNLKTIESLLNLQISHHYTYTNPETNQIEFQEDINIDIEEQILEHLAFYKKTNIDLPPNFEDTIRAIWNRNYTEIQSQIEQFGFNGILIVPPNIPLPELANKMKLPDATQPQNKPVDGYCLGDNFKNEGGFQTCISTGTDKPRIILYHKKTLPEIQKQNGIDPHQNITAEKAQKLYDANPDKFIITLEDAIILERKHFDETNVHISNYNTKSGVWLSGTKQQGSTRFVSSCWRPDVSALSVSADVAGAAYSGIGCRPSRYFI